MAEQRDDRRSGDPDKPGERQPPEARQRSGEAGQPIGGNDSNTGSGTTMTQGAEFSGAGSEPPRSMGTHGTEFGQMSDHDRSGQQGQSGTGQADLGSQAATTLSGHTDQQDLGTGQPGSVGGASGRQGEGFMAQQGSGSDDEAAASEASSAQPAEGSDFAREGQGALEGEQEDIEGGQPRGERSDVERD